MAQKDTRKYVKNWEAIQEGDRIAAKHPLVAALPRFQLAGGGKALELAREEWLVASCDAPARYVGGRPNEPMVTVWPNVRRRSEPEEWAYVFARMRLHIALNHLDPAQQDRAHALAAWVVAEEMVAHAGVGRRPGEFPSAPVGLPRSQSALVQYFSEQKPAPEIDGLSLSSPGAPYWSFTQSFEIDDALRAQRAADLARGIRAAAAEAIDVAGGVRETMGAGKRGDTRIKQARAWFISEFPLLASLAASFTLIEDGALCDAMKVEVAAICDETQEIYFNPRVSFTEQEARFVMAHELLHTGLRHTARRQGRGAWFWNVACDYVINDWLIEMQVGHPPDRVGYLYDPELRGLSAEEVYDRIVGDLRWMRKLKKARTLNGAGSDMLERNHGSAWWRGGGVDLDAFYRRALAEGLELHLQGGRGLLPAGLVEEIRALQQPPVPWDVKLGHWLDQYFPPLEKRRTYARASRRQSSTPDIPRPAWHSPEEDRAARVFGVVIDTSGSMSRADIGKALGAIASYAMSRDVGFVRLVQCDAAAHDAGYVEPEALLERVEVRGRGGTMLMPGIRLLENAHDFPKDGPILVITDGACDPLTIGRNHAYLLAHGGRLPFRAVGPVFQFS